MNAVQRRVHHWLKSNFFGAHRFGGVLPRQRAVKRRVAAVMEPLEPRILLSADTIVDTPNATYLANPTLDLVLDDVRGGLDAIEDVLGKAAEVADFADGLGIDIPGLLDRAGGVPADFAAPRLEALLDLGAVLGAEGFTSVDPGSADTGAKKIGDFYDNDALDLADLFHQYVLGAFNVAGPTTLAAIEATLDGLSANVGPYVLGVEVGDVAFAAGNTELLFTDFVLDLRRTDSFSLDLGRNADALELGYGSDSAASVLPSVSLETFFEFRADLGLAITVSELAPGSGANTADTVVTGGVFFLRDASVAAGAEADVVLGDLDLTLGFLEIESTGGSFELTAAVRATLANPDGSGDGRITVAEIADALVAGGAYEFEDLVPAGAVVADGDVDVELPVTVKAVGFGGFDGVFGALTPKVVLSGSPFADAVQSVAGDDPRTALAVGLEDFDVLKPFRNIDDVGVVGVLESLKTFLDQFESLSNLFGANLPFADATQISKVIDFGGALDELIGDLTDENLGTVVAEFTSAQSLASKLDAVLTSIGLGGIAPTYVYDPGGAGVTLSYTFVFADVFTPAAADFDFGLDLAPLGDFAVTGSLGIEAALDLAFTVGIDLGGEGDVAVASVFTPFSLVSLIRSTGNPVPVSGVLTQDARFRLTLGGLGHVDVELEAADTTLNGDRSDLAADLGLAIDAALTAAGIAAKVRVDAVDTDGVAGADRLRITTFNTPFLEITRLADDPGGFDALGFDNGQEATSSPLPANGVLAAAAQFTLTLGRTSGLTSHAIGVVPDATNAAAADPLEALRLDVQGAINAAFLGNGFAADSIRVDLVGSEASGYQLRITAPDNAPFLRIDSVNTVAARELGLVNDSVASNLRLVAARNLQYGGPGDGLADAGNPLPSNGQLAADAAFTITLAQGAASTGALAVGVLQASTADNNSAADLAEDINTALAGVLLPGGAPLASVLVANAVEFTDTEGNGTGQFGLRFAQPFAPLGAAEFALSDSLTIAGVAGDPLGLLDGTAAVDGPRTDGALGGNPSFVLELTDDSGALHAVTIAFADAGVTDLPSLVDAINTAIDGTTMASMVVAGLDGARVVFAATPLADADPGAGLVPAKILRITGVDGVADAAVGLDQGMNARLRGEVNAFVRDVALEAAIELDGSATGSVRFGFVEITGGLEGGLPSGNVAEAAVSVNFATAAPIYLTSLIDALGSVDALRDLLDEDSSGALLHLGTGGTEEINLSGAAALELGNIQVQGLTGGDDGVLDDIAGTLTGTPKIAIGLVDLFDLDTLAVTPNGDFGLSGLADFADFGFDDVLVLLDQVVEFLSGFSELSFLSDPLPLIDVTLVDALGFVEDFVAAVQDVAANPTATIAGLLASLQEGLQQFPLAQAALEFTKNSPGVLTLNLGFQREIAKFLPLNLSLTDLAAAAGVSIPADLINLSGQANLAAQFGIDVNLSVGVDVAKLADEVRDNPLEAGYLEDILAAIFLNTGLPSAGGTGIELTAFASASNVTFTGAVGPLGVFVSNGAAVLNADGVLGNTAPAAFSVQVPDLGASTSDGRITLADIVDFPTLFSQIDVQDLVALNLGIGAVLPVSFPTASSFLGNLAFAASIDDPFDLGSIQYAVTSFPDFSAIDLSNLGILDTLSLFLEGTDLAFGTLGDLLTGKVFGIDDISDLPLIGDALADAGDFIETIRNEVIGPVTEIVQGAPDLIAGLFVEIGEHIQNALSAIGFLEDAVGISFAASPAKTFDFANALTPGELADLAQEVLDAEEFWFTIPIHKTFTYSAPDVDLGALEVFKLEIEDPVTVTLEVDFDLGLGVSLEDGFFLQFDGSGEVFDIALSVDLPSSLTGRLFLFELTATDEHAGADLLGKFNVNVEGLETVTVVDQDTNVSTDYGRVAFTDIPTLDFDVAFGAGVNIDLHLDLGLASNVGTGFPSIFADFGLAWGFEADAGDLAALGFTVADFPLNPEVSLGGIGIDLGSFISNVIGPFLEKIDEYLGPVGDVIDVVTDPIPVLSDLLGPTSLLDVAATFGFADPSLVTAIEILDQIFDLAETISATSESAVLYFADLFSGFPEAFVLGGDGSGAINLMDEGVAALLADPGKAVSEILDTLGLQGSALGDAVEFIASGFNADAIMGAAGGNVGAAGSLLSGNDVGGFSFPFLENFNELLGVFFGRPLTFVAYDLPPLAFGWTFNIFISLFDGLGVRLSGGINATLDFAFGYDSEGIRLFADNGFENPLDLLQGFFVYDDNPFTGVPGVDVPEVVVTGEINAAAELNVVVASAGVGGGITATINFDLNDPNQDMRVRIDEILSNLFNGFDELGFPAGLICIFDTSGEVTARLYAYVEALFGVWRKEWTFGETDPLIEFNYSCPHPPVLATDMEDGTLRLNTGRNAEFRTYTNNGAKTPVDGAETIYVASVPGGYEIWGSGPDFNVPQVERQFYEGSFTRIVGYGDKGDDTIDLSQVTGAVATTLQGGVGNDRITGGAGADAITGDSGNDVLRGGDGADVVEGGAGDDCIEGGAAGDTLLGGVGNDTLVGGAGDDVLLGNEDNDVLAGDAGNDRMLGGSGRDLLSGGVGGDVLAGEADDDRMWGDYAFQFTGDCLLTLVGGDEPALTVPAVGDQGDDLLSGGGGSDEIQGNGGVDKIWGDSRFVFDTAMVLQMAGADPLLQLPDYGTFGDDNLSGGGGGDVLYGEKGNDILRGDNTRVDLEDDDNPRTFVEGDPLGVGSAGTVDPGDGADGVDSLWGGPGSDILFGNAGNDTLYGQGENDYLFGNDDADTIVGDAGVDIIFGDDGFVDLFTAGEAIEGGGSYAAFTVDLQKLTTTTPANPGDDTIDGGQDVDYIFGGGGDGLLLHLGQPVEDVIEAGAADDIVFGDNGEVVFAYSNTVGKSLPTLIQSTLRDEGGKDVLKGSSGRDIVIGGKGGDVIDGDVGNEPAGIDSRDILGGDHLRITQIIRSGAAPKLAAPDVIESSESDPSQGGADLIDGKQDDDVIVAGPGGDIVTGGFGDDTVIGDRGLLDYDTAVVVGPAQLFTLTQIRTTDLATDSFTGIDVLSGGAGADTVFGGGRGDTLYGDAEADGTTYLGVPGGDILVGDNGQIDYLGGIPARIQTTDTTNATGGDDQAYGSDAGDVVVGGVGGDELTGDAGDDLLLGDNGRIEYNLGGDGILELDEVATADFALGAADDLSGGGGGDVALGGTGGDTIHGDDSLGGTPATAPGADILIGDQGRVYYQFSSVNSLSVIETTDLAEADGGADALTGNEADDVLLGGVEGDTLAGEEGNDILLGDEGRLDYHLGADGNFALDRIATERFGLGTGDSISGGGGADFAFGGAGDDTVRGDNTLLGAADVAPGADVLVGDQGRVDFRFAAGTNYLTRVTTTDTAEGDGGVDAIEGNEARDILLGGVRGDVLSGNAGDDVVLGDDGLLQFDVDADWSALDLIRSEVNALLGGSDFITGNSGADVALGGTAGDVIYGDDAVAGGGGSDLWDILLGDNGEIVFKRLADYPGSGPDARTVLGGTVSVLRTTDDEAATGGKDTVTGNAAADILMGGVLGDRVYGDAVAPGTFDGDDILLGDNGRLEWLYGGAAGFAALESGFLFDTTLTTLDLVTTELPAAHPGGRDWLVGFAGRDLLFGGEDADTLLGDDGDLEATTISGAADVLFGDHGRIYPQHSALPNFPSRNFFSIDTGDNANGEGDRIWGEEGDDIGLGGQGDDRLFGGTGDDDLIGGHNVAGGVDELSAPAVVATLNPALNDAIDGGAGRDALAGDNATIWRRGDAVNPRFRTLAAGETTIYTTTDDALFTNVDGTHRSDPTGGVGRDIELYDHAVNTPAGLFGSDVLSGGAESDSLFGELGNDLLAGDGLIGADDGVVSTPTHALVFADSGVDPDTDQTLYLNVPEATTDGDDYVEGNGGDDLIYGGLGQDDLVGGSSALFGLNTPAKRPDGADVIYGGAGMRLQRNDVGDAASLGHGRDADFIVGDNANVFRLVAAAGGYLTFGYDNGGGIRIIPRAIQQLDYTLGGPDAVGAAPNASGQAPGDHGTTDRLFGEDGDDVIFGMTGSDVLFGNAQDDDLVGGYGHDWVSGGTGQDGLIGDDGLIFTSRNGIAEPLYGIAATSPSTISTPGKIQIAEINAAGELKKSVDLTLFSVDPAWNAQDDEFPDAAGAGRVPFADDILFGGLGGDFLHGGSGDDAISGAEALASAWVPVYDAGGNPVATLDLGYGAMLSVSGPVNPGDVLAFNAEDADGQHTNNRFRAGEFALYDEYEPLRAVLLTASGELSKSGAGLEFLLNFNPTEGPSHPGGTTGGPKGEPYAAVNDDGNDALFGDVGNDWLVGGTGRDHLYGGWGNDLLNADDDARTQGGLNEQPDTHPNYEDRAYGGAGRDVLIANTGGDRLIDWVGEYNSYLVPFAPFGMATVSRTLQPQLPEFLYALSKADGADVTRAGDTGADALRQGEPAGELGLVLQKDFAWQDQTGAPADPQAGNIPGGKRDVLRGADFNNGQSQGFAADSGSWRVVGGRYQVAPAAAGGDAVSVFYVDSYVPGYFEIQATLNAVKPTGGAGANAYLVFDYQGPTDFKFAGLNVATNKLEIGHRTAQGWTVHKQGVFTGSLKSGADYNVLLASNGSAVSFVVNNQVTLSHAFAPRVDAYGFSHGLNDGMVGLGAQNARAFIDNVVVQRLAPIVTLERTVDFGSGPTSLLQPPLSGAWSTADGRYLTSATAESPAISALDLTFGPNSWVELSARLSTLGQAGLVFDLYGPDDYKFLKLDVITRELVLGHRTHRGWFTDAVVPYSALASGIDHVVGLTLKGTTASVTVNGQAVLSRVYNAVATDGAAGVFALGGMASFDTVTVRSDDPQFGVGNPS